MKTSALTLIATAILASSFSAARAEPPSYPLVCRPNASMTATVKGNGVVTLKFKASEAGGAMDPGECTWKDRPLNEDEPTRIRAEDDLAMELIEKLLGGAKFTVKVYNDGEGNMIMTE